MASAGAGGFEGTVGGRRTGRVPDVCGRAALRRGATATGEGARAATAGDGRLPPVGAALGDADGQTGGDTGCARGDGRRSGRGFLSGHRGWEATRDGRAVTRCDHCYGTSSVARSGYRPTGGRGRSRLDGARRVRRARP